MNNGFLLSKTWFYILSFTWGIMMTALGMILSLVMLCTGHRPHKNAYGWYFVTKQNLGGFNAGPCSIVCENPSAHMLQHEFGHSIQNCIFGPFIIPFIVLPSVCRFWYREIKHTSSPAYDYAWYEGLATLFGERYKDVV